MSKGFEGGHQHGQDPAIRIVSRLEVHLKSRELSRRLLAGGARIHVDFHADRHFDDLRRFPGHLALLFERTASVLRDKLLRNEKFAS